MGNAVESLSFVVSMLQAMFLALVTNYVIDRFLEVYPRRAFTMKKRVFAEDEVVIPPRVAAWIPFFGSSLELGRQQQGGGGVNAFVRKYATKFQSPVVSATLAGGTVCHFFAKPSDVIAGFATATAAADKYLDATDIKKNFLVRVCGANPHAVDHEVTAATTKKGLSLFHTAVLNAENLQQNLRKTQQILKEQTDKVLPQDARDWTKVKLYEFCMAVVYKATIGPIISTAVIDDLVSDFAEWEAGAPLLLPKLPSFLIPSKPIKARERMVEAMKKHEEALMKGASKMCKARKEMHSADLFRRTLLSISFDVAGNSIPAAFWTIACILSDADALRAVREELDGATTGTTSAAPDAAHGYPLSVLDSWTTLHAIFTEVMRLYTSSYAARDVVKDMVVTSTSYEGRPKKFLLKEGTRIMACPSILHSDPEVFDQPEKFVWNRFLPTQKEGGNHANAAVVFEVEGKEITNPVIPFGGGGGRKCPGRHFVEHEIKSLVAYLLVNYDVRIADPSTTTADTGPALPEVDHQSQGMGILRPKGDFVMEVRRKTKRTEI